MDKTPEELEQEASAVALGLPPKPSSPYVEAAKFKAEQAAKADLERRTRDYEKLSPKEQYQTAVELGLIPEGSKYVSGLTIDYSKSGMTASEIEAAKRRATSLTGKPVGGWGYYTPEQLSEISRVETISTSRRDDINKAISALSLYKTEQGYDLQRAFAEGKGKLVYDARALGLFTPEQVVQAQFGAIDDGMEKEVSIQLIPGIEEQQKPPLPPGDVYMSAYEPATDATIWDKFVSFFTGKGVGKLGEGSKYLEASIPGYFTGLSKDQYNLQVETEALYRDLFKQDYGRYPSYDETPVIRAGLPRSIQLASLAPGAVTAYKWDTLNTNQKLDAVMGDIAQAALYGMMAVGLTYQPNKAPIVKYQVIDTMGNLTGREVKIPIATGDTAATKFAQYNPTWVKVGVDPIKIYGEMGGKPIKPVLSPNPLLASIDWKNVPTTMKGGVKTPSGLIPARFIPSKSVFPGGSYTAPNGVIIKMPPALIQTDALIPSGMELWSRVGVEQPWSPFAHNGARILTHPVTGEFTIIDTATGRTRVISPNGFISVGLGGSLPVKPSTMTMTPDQLAKIEGDVEVEPYLWFEETPEGMIIPRITMYPKPQTIEIPSIASGVSDKPQIRLITTPEDLFRLETVSSNVRLIKPELGEAPAIKPAVSPRAKPVVSSQPALASTTLTSAPPLSTFTPPSAAHRPIPPPPMGLIGEEEAEWGDKLGEIKAGTIAWRQGLFWIILPPPYNKKYYQKRAPKGAYRFAVGEDSAYKTIQVIGGLPTKDIKDIDIGIALVDIIKKDKKVEIKFKQDVRDTYKGKTKTDEIMSFRKPRYMREYKEPVMKMEPRKIKRNVEIGDRTYLGHKLRTPELKVLL